MVKVDQLAQEIWQAYVLETGQSMPEGLADKMAQRVAAAIKIDVERLARALWNADKPWNTCDGNPYGPLRPVEFDAATEGMRRWYRQMAERVAAELDKEET